MLGVELDDLPKSNEDKYLMLIQKDGKYIFTNGGSKEYSFGSAYNFSQKVTKDNILSFAGKSISFKWKYQNSYDKKNGVADVTLYIYQRPGSYYVRGVIIAGEDKINVNGSVILK